jgi:ABC-type lipoprotein release transport system permease subunit
VLAVRLALRNVWRNPARSLVTTAAVVAGVAVLVLGEAVIGGLEENIVRGEVDARSSHVLIRGADAGPFLTADALLSVPPALSQALEARAAAWTERLVFPVRATRGTREVRLTVYGIEPDRDAHVFPRTTWRLDGREPGPGELLLSAAAARALEANVGDIVGIEVASVGGALDAARWTVSGRYTTGNPALDRFCAFAQRSDADALLHADGRASHVAVRLPSRAEAAAFASKVAPDAPPGSTVRTWVDETADMMALQAVRQRALELLVGALLAMSASGIANTMFMAIHERTQEIGTLRALGMTRVSVAVTLTLEGAILGALGSGLGVGLAAVVVAHGHTAGIDLGPLLSRAGGALPIASMLYLPLQPGVWSAAASFGLLVAVVGSAVPAWVGAGGHPADAMRGST